MTENISEEEYEIFNGAIERMKKDALIFSKQIQPLYEMFDFEWFGTLIPTSEEIYDFILELMDSMVLEKEGVDAVSEISSGRISIWYINEIDKKDPLYGMRLEIEQWYYNDICEQKIKRV